MTDRDIVWLNEQLRDIQPRLEERSHPDWPSIFVIGPPRSGTTLVSQVLAAGGCFGYISNFLARFWMAPAVGALVEQLSGLAEAPFCPSFRSDHGRTEGWKEPHEFGWFWNRWFDFGQETHFLNREERTRVDRIGLAREVAGLEGVFKRPMCFKNNTWCTFQADYLLEVFPNALFVVCRRDPVFVAQSLLLARRKWYGADDSWWSIRPRRTAELCTLEPLMQVAGQAVEIEKDMDDALSRVPTEQCVDASYRRLCTNPGAMLGDIFGKLDAMSAECFTTSMDIRPFKSADVPRLPCAEWKRLKGCVERYKCDHSPA